MLEQLVQAVDARREHVAETLHEPVEVGRAAFHALLEHLVQLAHHVSNSREVLSLHLLKRAFDALEHLVQDLFLKLLHQLFEFLPRRVVDELVVAQSLDPPAEVVREAVELVVALSRYAVEQLARLGRRVLQPLLDPGPLGVDHVLHLLPELFHSRVEVVAA